MRSEVAIQRAYHAKDRGLGYSERVQAEAERLALIDGDPEEARRRRNAGMDLAKKQRQPKEGAFALPVWLMRDLGGARDTIAYLIKDRALTVGHGKTALLLREHVEGVTIDIAGGGEFGVFVDGGTDAGLEGWCDKRRYGVEAWRLAMEASEPKARKAVQKVIQGRAGLKQARRLIGGGNDAAHKMLKANLVKALDAASAYLGAGG